METVMMSQMFTQTAQPRRGGGTEKFVDAIINFHQKHPESLEGIGESTRKAVVTNLRILGNDTKWQSLGRLLIQMCSEDRGGKLCEFTHSIFSLSCLLPDAPEIEQLRLKTIKFLIDVITRVDVSIPNFFGLYNDIMVYLEKVSNDGLIHLVKHVSAELVEGVEMNSDGKGDVENQNQGAMMEKKCNQRWRDFLSVLIKRIREVAEIEYDNDSIPGSEAADKILFDWLKISDNEEAFELLADVANSSGSDDSIGRFCDDVIALEIGIEHTAEDQNAERTRRALMTWKTVILTTKVEKERAMKLWNAVICAWEVGEEAEKEMKESRKMSACLEKCLLVGHRVLSGNFEAAKRFLSLIRTDKFRVLSSEFGLTLSLVQCHMDRNDALGDMKKSLQKLFRAGEQSEECVWMSNIVCGRLLRVTDLQLRVLAESLTTNETFCRLISRPLFSLMLSLLDTPAYQKQVVVVDGKVADGCSLWLLSRDILITVSLAQTDMAAQLSNLFQSIASTSNNSSALILIDVLRELVKKCSVEILNNSKLIDKLFDYVCRMRRDISVSLIRCLLPIINTRPQLRTALFKSLKKDLLCESTVSSAVPIVLLLLRSVSKRREDGGGGQFDHSMSQSFGSFSTQTLNIMGCKKTVDQSVGLELIGIVRRCLWQPVTTKLALYDGICELATQTTTMLNQFLDMIVSHAKMAPEWRKCDMTTVNGSVVQIVEPMPHLIQTVECLMSELSSFDPEFRIDGTELLLKQGAAQMEKWVETAMRSDAADLGLDRNLEWTTGTVNGRSSLLFAQMMLSTYDVLIEHMWRRIEGTECQEDADKLVALLNRRKELDALYKEKTTTKKEKEKEKDKTVEKVTVDTTQTEILTGAKTLASILKKLMENGEGDTTINVRPEILADVQLELMGWAVGRAKILTTAIVKEYRPLHSILAGTNSLISLSKALIDFYVGTDAPAWIVEIEVGTQLKTSAIETYALIIQFLSVKYKQTPARVTMMWFEEKEGEDEEARRKRLDPNILALRQAHFLSCRLFRQVLDVENEDIEEEKRPKALYETQGRAILRAATAVLSMTKNVKVWSNLFTRLTKVLEEETFYNNQMLRDFTKFTTSCALRCADTDNATMKEMKMIMENVLEFLSEEGEELKYHFISKTTLNVVIEFLFDYVEKSLALIREAFGFQKDFNVKPPAFDAMLSALLEKCVDLTDLVSGVLQIFVQYKMMQERVTEVMSNYFSTITMAVLLLHSLTRPFASEMSDWNCVNTLAALVKTKLTPLLAMVDDHIGFSKGKEEMKTKIPQKTRYAKSKKAEKLFSRFSHERESVQHGILVLCKLIKDERFDLQIKNNSIGYRDFRIDMDMIRSKLGGEANEEIHEPSQKRRRKGRNAEEEEAETDGEVNDEDDEEEANSSRNTTSTTTAPARSSEEPEEERAEEPRAAETTGATATTTAVVKQEVEEAMEEAEAERGESPVF